MKTNFKIVLLGAVMLFLPTMINAKSIPSTISYQGRLVDRNNVPYTGIVNPMVLSLYDAVSLGNQIWTESQPNVSVVRGVFNVQLGSVSPLPPTIFSNALWLDVNIGGVSMTPRRPLLPSPYAFSAGIAYSMTNNSITSNMIKPQNITSSNIKNYTIRYLDLASN